MKRIAHTLKDASSIIGIAVIIGTTVFAASKASAQEDIYQIEQQIDETFSKLHLEIDDGWDVRLIQAPKGSATTVVISTRCAEFFEEGTEPSIVTVRKPFKKLGEMLIEKNTSMPRSTIVEIHTSQPINHIKMYKNARLTIEQYDFDSVDLDIDADSGATLVVDTMHNLGETSISLHDATLDLRRFKGHNLFIRGHGNSTVNKGKLWASNQWIHLGEKAVSNVTATDSATHLYVDRKRWRDRTDNLTSLTLDFGFDTRFPIAGTDGVRQGSPYNTYIDLGINLRMRTNDIPLGGRWSWNIGLVGTYHMMLLDNVVKPSGTDKLVLDASHGATPPRQQLLYWDLGIPVSIKYTLPKEYHPWFYGFHATLTPMVNFKQTLGTQTLGSNHRWTRTEDKHLDLLNRFNLRASIGVDTHILGLRSVDFFIDLLPTYKPTADAPQVRMMGLIYHL